MACKANPCMSVQVSVARVREWSSVHFEEGKNEIARETNESWQGEGRAQIKKKEVFKR